MDSLRKGSVMWKTFARHNVCMFMLHSPRVTVTAESPSAGFRSSSGAGSENIHSLRWRHNDFDNVSNHQPHGCLLNRLFRRRSKKTSKLRVTGLCVGNSPGPVNSPHKGPVTRKMIPFDDVIMCWVNAMATPCITKLSTVLVLCVVVLSMKKV